MAYIGNQPTDNFVTFATQNFSTSATSSYTLDHAVSNENEIALFINNVRQHPGSGKAYTATGTALTLSENTASTDVMYCIFLGRAIQSTVPSTNSITAAMVSNDLISGKTALASEPADTDEFLVSDAGTLKRIDYSLIKGGGITEADQWRITSNHTPGGSAAIISSNWERVDTDGFGHIGTGMSESSGIFTFPSTGFYLININFWYAELTTDYIVGYIYTTTDNSSYGDAAGSVGSGDNTSKNNTGSMQFIFDVTNTSTHKVAFYALRHGSNAQIKGSSSTNQSAVSFIRLGDT
tara:strand:- start:2046 stop:2927 length:882 start_codon:yes stop_codon:yes gene_type:complete